MNSKPLITIGGIVVALIIVARLSKLRHLSPESTQRLLPVFLTIGVVVLIFLVVLGIMKSRVEAKNAAALTDLKTALEPGLREVRERVIAAGLATPQNVDQVIRAMNQPDFKAILGIHTYLKRKDFR